MARVVNRKQVDVTSFRNFRLSWNALIAHCDCATLSKGGGYGLSANFKGLGRHPPTAVGARKLKSLCYLVALFA